MKKKYLLCIVMSAYFPCTFAQGMTQCPKGQEIITAVKHSICANVNLQNNDVINVVMAAKEGSPLADMHKTFGPKIYQEYLEDVKIQKIPDAVEKLIRFVEYLGNNYECKQLTVTSDAILKMTNCTKQKSNT